VVETRARAEGTPGEPRAETPSCSRMTAPCVAATGIGLTVPVSQHLRVSGPMADDWMAPASVGNATDFDPTAAVVYLVGALPFVTIPAASVSFVAGNAVLRPRARLHAT